MNLIIQIPCYNEEATLGTTLSALPKELPGMDRVEWLIVNDGSTDRTVEVAVEYGVDHVITVPHNQGLANAFRTGISACLEKGADIIVNTDADNQYCADDIEKLIAPIICGQADIVIGSRPIGQIEHFSGIKKALQKLGSAVVRLVSGTDVSDAASGFRAISREAALRLNVFGEYTYTLEMLIQAGHHGMIVQQVPIRVNGELRPSRLVRNIPSYVFRSISTIFRIFAIYRPLRFFLALGSIPVLVGHVLFFRWLYLRMTEIPVTGHSHVPSLVAAAVSVLFGFQLWVLALVADLLAANRKILEGLQLQQRREHVARKGGARRAAAA